MSNILIVGGAGMQGRAIAEDLLTLDTGNITGLTLADINTEALNRLVGKLADPRVKGEKVDLRNHDELVSMIKRHDLIVNCGSSPMIGLVVQAAMDAGVNLCGLADVATGGFEGVPANEFGFVTQEFLDKIDEGYKKAGIMGITGIGYVPGITNTFGRLLGDKFDTIESMNWYYGTQSCGDKSFFTEAPGEMAMLFNFPRSPIFRDGKFMYINPKEDRVTVQFPEPIGEVSCQHMPFMSIIRVFQERYAAKGIKNADVYLGYWPGYVKKMDFLDSVGMLDMEPRNVDGQQVVPFRVFLSGRGVGSQEGMNLQEYGCVKIVVDGTVGGKKVTYTGEALGRPIRNLGAMQIMTALPAAVCIQNVLKGKYTKKGFYTTQDDSIDPIDYFKDLGRRGFKFSITTDKGTEVLVDGSPE